MSTEYWTPGLSTFQNIPKVAGEAFYMTYAAESMPILAKLNVNPAPFFEFRTRHINSGHVTRMLATKFRIAQTVTFSNFLVFTGPSFS
jgi:hypothetical protein